MLGLQLFSQLFPLNWSDVHFYIRKEACWWRVPPSHIQVRTLDTYLEVAQSAYKPSLFYSHSPYFAFVIRVSLKALEMVFLYLHQREALEQSHGILQPLNNFYLWEETNKQKDSIINLLQSWCTFHCECVCQHRGQPTRKKKYDMFPKICGCWCKITFHYSLSQSYNVNREHLSELLNLKDW